MVSTNCADISRGPTDSDLWGGHIFLPLCSPQPHSEPHTLAHMCPTSTSPQQEKGPPGACALCVLGLLPSEAPLLHLYSHYSPIFLKSLLLPKSCPFLRPRISLTSKANAQTVQGPQALHHPKGCGCGGLLGPSHPGGPAQRVTRIPHPHPSPINPVLIYGLFGQFFPCVPPLRRTVSQGQVYYREHTNLFQSI